MERTVFYKRQLNGAEDRQLWCLGGTTSEEWAPWPLSVQHAVRLELVDLT